MISSRYVHSLFQLIDQRNAQAFASEFTDAGAFRFGNAPALLGPAAIEDTVGGFFSAIGGLRHELLDCWEQADASFCHGQVSYQRLDGSRLEVPFAVILRGEEKALREYLIFVDNSELFGG